MTKMIDMIKFDEKGLVPVVIQDHRSKMVLTLCYMNREAFERTLREGRVYVYRRSRGELMMKGQISGCTQKVKSLCIDCEGNSVLLRVEQKIAACHTGYFTCYFRKMAKGGGLKIVARRVFDPKKVYR